MACPYGIFTARDGYLFICAAADRHWRDLCSAMNRPDLASDHPWALRPSREADKVAVNAFLDVWLCSLASRDAAVALLQTHRVPVGPVHTVDEVVHHGALRASGSVRTVRDPVLGTIDVVGFPLHFSAFETEAVNGEIPADVEAPFLGEHNREALVGEARLSPELFEELVAAGVLQYEPVSPRASVQRPSRLGGTAVQS